MGSPIRKSPDHSLIDSSPKLTAVFHFLHRLLMPRHPPNALFALDLIQEKQGFPRSKAFTSRSRLVRPGTFWVSVLDLDNAAVPLPGGGPLLGPSAALIVYLSERCQTSLPVILTDDPGLRPVGRSSASADALGDSTGTWWSVTGSNR